MKKLLMFFFVSGLSFAASSQLPIKIDLCGQWEFRKSGTSEWFPASVPGCVQLDLLRNRIIGDLFYRGNEDSIQWIAENDWEYRRFFYLDGQVLSSTRIALVLEGLDTYADVYLNGSPVVTANNMFREWSCEDAKSKLHKGKNELRLQFWSVTRQNKELYEKLKFKLPGDEKVVCRKAAYNFGWDWGPRIITMGIWKPVYLRAYKFTNLTGVQFIQKKLSDSSATVSGVFSITSDRSGKVSVRIENDKALIAVFADSVKMGSNVIRKDFLIKNPKLWWPNGTGAQNLYTLSYEVYFDGDLVDRGLQKIGLRTIELVQRPDSSGRSFYFLVNHVPVFMKGANYIPQDNFPSRVSDSAYRAMLTEARDMNMNMLRVWGGGIYEKDVFYDLCDESGILVWQDFMFACAMYPGDKEFMNNVNTESVQNISRLRRHPCIALWCGNNEIDEGWKNWGWVGQYKYKPQDSAVVYHWYKEIFNEMLQANVRIFDTLRPYVPTSPMFGWGNPKSRSTGDMHYWGVWWGKQPFAKYRENTGRFMTEYGFQGFPDFSSLKKITVPGDLKPGSAVMKAHQKHPAGYELIDEYLLREYRKPRDFESYAYVSQLVQAEGIKTAIEAHRRAMPYCMGTLFWQYNDCWPVVSWSARDYYGVPKALSYYVRNTFRDILVSPVFGKGRLRVYIISDRILATKGNLDIRITDFNGTVLRDSIKEVDIPSLSSNIYFDVDSALFMKGLDPAKLVLSSVFTCTGNKLAPYTNTLYFLPVKDLLLEKPGLTMRISKTGGGFMITLTTDMLAKNVWLSTDIRGEFSENFSDVIPGRPLKVYFMTTYNQNDLADKIRIHTVRDTY